LGKKIGEQDSRGNPVSYAAIRGTRLAENIVQKVSKILDVTLYSVGYCCLKLEQRVFYNKSFPVP